MTTWVSRYQKGKTNLDFTEARDSEWQWHQLGNIQVCTSLQTDNHASTSPLSFLQAGCPSCRPTNSVKELKALYLTVTIKSFLSYFKSKFDIMTFTAKGAQCYEHTENMIYGDWPLAAVREVCTSRSTICLQAASTLGTCWSSSTFNNWIQSSITQPTITTIHIHSDNETIQMKSITMFHIIHTWTIHFPRKKWTDGFWQKYHTNDGGSVAEWLACCTQAQ